MLTGDDALKILKKLHGLAYTAERYCDGYPDEQELAREQVKEILHILWNLNL